MANTEEFKNIARARLKSVKVLMEAEDWDGAAYLMGFVLECALKAAACKTLRLLTYPQYTGKEKIDGYFMTHRFEQLLITSGTEDIFSARGPVQSFYSWSEFTKEYPGDWPGMRYDKARQAQFTSAKVKILHVHLNAILEVLTKKRRW